MKDIYKSIEEINDRIKPLALLECKCPSCGGDTLDFHIERWNISPDSNKPVYCGFLCTAECDECGFITADDDSTRPLAIEGVLNDINNWKGNENDNEENN